MCNAGDCFKYYRLEEEAGLLNYNIKIALTRTKVCYSVSFLLILALIRGISSPGEIGAAMDANVALLAIIFCSDTYYQEIQDNRWEVFNLLPDRNRYHTICQRLLLQVIYISLLTSLDYWVFYLQKAVYWNESGKLRLYITAVLACSASVLFFGTLSFTMVNIFRNLWIGIGCTFLLWNTLNSTAGQKIPDCINVFAYGNSLKMAGSADWIFGKLVAVVVSVLLIYFNKRFLVWKKGLR